LSVQGLYFRGLSVQDLISSVCTSRLCLSRIYLSGRSVQGLGGWTTTICYMYILVKQTRPDLVVFRWLDDDHQLLFMFGPEAGGFGTHLTSTIENKSS
jgi:hypothetical protein